MRQTTLGIIIAKVAKVIIIGKERVGKTSLRKKYLGQGFTANHLPTMGADFAVKDVSVDDTLMKLQIWDIAGQPAFQPIRKRFYSNAYGALVVYDTTDEDSFQSVSDWLKEMWNVLNRINIPILLIGNKIDLTDHRVISTSKAERYVEQLVEKTKLEQENIDFIETSAKTGENVEEAFQRLASKINSAIEKNEL